MTATERWADALRQWAIPDEILAAAPQSPWSFPVGIFVDAARRSLREPPTPTHRRVVEVMPGGGTLIDVGSGAGAASVPLAPPTGRIVAVDEDEQMIQALTALAAERAEVVGVVGRWPDVAGQVVAADVVVCANVAYNVADLGPFVVALTRAARVRVVLELSAAHPQSPLSPLWERFWGLRRPTTPTYDDAIAVVQEVTGQAPHAERWRRDRPLMGGDDAETVAWLRRRLCLGEDRSDDVAAAAREMSVLGPADMVTLWWGGEAASDDLPSAHAR